MRAEAATVAADPAPRELPTLQPIYVLDEAQVDELGRAARAGVAMLSLQMRTLPTPAPVPPAVGSVGAAEVLLRSSLEQCLDTRRSELRDQLEQARAEAAAHVAGARHEAATLVADATEETLQVLLRGLRPTGGAPALRVVTDETSRRSLLASASAPQPAAVGAHPAGAGNVAAPEAAPVTISAERAAPADDVLEPAAMGDPVVAASDPDDDHARARTGSAPAALEGSIARAVSTAIAEVFQMGVAAGPIVLAAPPAATAAVPAIAGAPAVGTATETASITARRGVARFLYADVLLPMIAVVIVLVILLAWVG